VAFSSNGKLALVGRYLWDLATGREISGFKINGTPYWDLTTGREVPGSDDGKGPISAAFSRYDRFIVIGRGWHGTGFVQKVPEIQLLNAHTGHEIRRFEGLSVGLNSAGFSSDGRFLLTFDGAGHFWDLSIGRQTSFQAQEDVASITSSAVSPDGKLIVTGSFLPKATLWDVGTGREIREFMIGTAATSVAFSDDGRLVLTGNFDGTAGLWDAATGWKIRQFGAPDSLDYVMSVAFSRDGKFVLAGSQQGTARIWNAETGVETQRFEGPMVDDVKFSPDGRFVLIVAGGDTKLWDVESGNEIHRYGGVMLDKNEEVLSYGHCASFSPDGKFVLTGDDEASPASGTLPLDNSCEGSRAIQTK
jgi:WD40 repeat protein